MEKCSSEAIWNAQEVHPFSNKQRLTTTCASPSVRLSGGAVPSDRARLLPRSWLPSPWRRRAPPDRGLPGDRRRVDYCWRPRGAVRSGDLAPLVPGAPKSRLQLQAVMMPPEAPCTLHTAVSSSMSGSARLARVQSSGLTNVRVGTAPPHCSGSITGTPPCSNRSNWTSTAYSIGGELAAEDHLAQRLRGALADG
jgi:hypothetical protein